MKFFLAAMVVLACLIVKAQDEVVSGSDPSATVAATSGSLKEQTGIESLNKMSSCLSRINRAMIPRAAIRSDYVGTGEDHFIFSSVLSLFKDHRTHRSAIYLGPKGLFRCAIDFDKSQPATQRSFQFTVDGRLMQPYGPSGKDLGDVTNLCEPLTGDAADEATSKLTNQINANLTRLGAYLSNQGKTRDDVPAAVRKDCASFVTAGSFDGRIADGFHGKTKVNALRSIVFLK